MTPLSSMPSHRIRFLLESLDDSNSDSIFLELCKCTMHGVDGSILLLQTCFDDLNIYCKDLKNLKMHPLYTSIFRHILDKPNFSTVFNESLRSGEINEGFEVNEEFVQNLAGALQLSVPEKIGLGLALSDSENVDIRMCGKNFCIAQIAELCAKPTALVSAGQVQRILMFLNHSESLSKHVDSFMQLLSLVQLKEGTQFVLAPFVHEEAHEENFFRNLDLLNDGGEDDFDAILVDMEKEISMVDIMCELGYGCTLDVSHCKKTLSLYLPLSEVTIARILGTITRTYSGFHDNQNVFTTFYSAFDNNSVLELPSLSGWNVDVLVDSIKELAPEINWLTVMEKLDHDGFYIPNESAFSFFMSVYRYACQDPFPVHAICGFIWKNMEGQLSFLKYAVSASPDVFTFAHSESQLNYGDAQGYTLNYAWSCLDLLEVLCQLAERGHASFVRSVLESPLHYCPNLLLLGMVHVNTAYNLIQYEVTSAVLPTILKTASADSLILDLWHANQNMLVWGLTDAVNFDPDNIYRILDTCLGLKILSPVLDIIPAYFGVRLAAVASRKGFMDLESWLNTNLVTHRDAFYEECFKFVEEVQNGDHVASSNHLHSTDALINIYLEACPTFVKFLQSHSGVISSSPSSEEIEKMHVTYMRETPKIKNAVGSDSTSPESYPDDVEAEANSYFQQMFYGQLGIDAMIQMLARFKESSEKRERSIYGCMISSLLDEYNFITKYPERQLKIAAVLFGLLIKHQLVTDLSLGSAIRAVLDALRKPADSKMFVFGTKALEQFLDRLVEFPQYCNHILQISHLRATHPELVSFIERTLARISAAHAEPDVQSATSDHHNGLIQSSALNVEIPGSSFSLTGPGNSHAAGVQASSAIQLPQRLLSSVDERRTSETLTNYMKTAQSFAGQRSSAPSSDTSSIQKAHSAVGLPSLPSSNFPRSARGFGSALNIETLVAAAERRETPIEAPTSEIQDKISFIVNNLSISNIEAKAKELGEILNEQYHPWFAQYMVMKRASIEPNFHDLYLKFLDKVNLKPLNMEIVKTTYENCKVLLGSELIKSSVEERSLLKSLGSWLGKITIGNNKVLRAREIDPKSLIIEAYEKGLMIAVIPFTSKILDPCANSIAYRPPNPWTMGILGLLAEIYAMPNLKMNLKFDIEVLFKSLGVEFKDVTPTTLLVNKVREVEGNPDFSNKDVGSLQSSAVNEGKPVIISTRNQVEQPLDVAPPHATGHPRILPQYAPSPNITPGMLTDDEKLVSVGFSDQLPFPDLLQGQPPISVSQLSVPATNIEQQVVVNKKLQAYGLHMPIQSVLPIAMDRAVKEIVSSIIQRSVSIATQTTKELVLKDYSMELDDTLIRNAAHLMVARLAGSLAHVTCKEPLRGSISSQLRTLLQGSGISSDVLEQTVQLVTNDNLDLGCVLIEQAATEKAVQTIDGEIAPQLSIRRKHRESIGPTFSESSLYFQGQMSILPEVLRPKPGQLSHSQQRVYEDFARFPGQNRSYQSSNPVRVGPSASSGSGGLSRQFSSASSPISPDIYSSGFVNAGPGAVPQTFRIVSEDIDTNGSQIPPSDSSTLFEKGDGSSAQFLENDAGVSFSPTSTPEPEVVEPSDSTRESGTGKQPINATAASERLLSEPLLTTGDALYMYQTISDKLENMLANDAKEVEIQEVIVEVSAVILKCISRDEAALAVAQKAFKGLYEDASNSAHVNAHLAILATVRDVSKLVVKELTSWVIYSDDDRKFNKDIVVGLIRSKLLNLAEYNIHMAKLLDAGRNKAATEFAISLIQTLNLNDSDAMSELHNLVEALSKLAARPGSPECLQQLVEIAKNPATSAAALSAVNFGKEDNLRFSRDKVISLPGASREDDTSTELEDSDPPGFHEQVSVLFAEWYQICELPGANEAACARYILHLQNRGLLKGDEISGRFFRRLMELSVSHCLSSEVINSSSSHSGQPLSFLAIDIYAKLVFSALKFCAVDQGSSKLALLSKVLGVTIKLIQKDAEEKRASFNPRPYFRLFINWMLDLCSLDPVVDSANFQVLTSLANTLHAVQPLKVPSFSFAWLELVSNRSFMPKLLTVNAHKGWPYFQRLLLDLFQFMEPFLRNAELAEPVHFLYKGTLRVLLVLLHDFPEFLCDYHFSFCDVIPPSCIQMRNIVLSAFPRNMRLPDPSTPNLKIDLLAETHQLPRILSEVDAAIKSKQIKNDVDEYIKTRQQDSTFLGELKQKLLLSPIDAARAGTRYNVPLINSLVLHTGMQAIVIQSQSRAPGHSQSMSSVSSFTLKSDLDIFLTLMMDLDTEGRYLVLNAVANQLRYPNSHTYYFSYVILNLFNESKQETIQEQITRVLLERLIVNRPHPWGLLITFIELIKNSKYNFWGRSFTRCAPEIEKLFESVSRSCGGSKPVDENVVAGGGMPDSMH